MATSRRPIQPDAALRRMASLCARSEQCSHDILQRLQRMLQPDDARRILQRLIDGRFIDDSRFARAYANDKVRFAGWGERKIRMGLIAKRIPEQIITEAIDGIDPSWLAEAAMRAAAAKARSLDSSLPDYRQRLYRHLLSRGFMPDMISHTIRRMSESEDDD